MNLAGLFSLTPHLKVEISPTSFIRISSVFDIKANLERFDGSITNSTINGFLAQSNKGAALVLEHRFFGRSNPFPTLSERNLSRLTLNQTLEDIVYFATNVELPMPDGDQVSPDKAPWVLVGGSYAGALVAWTMTKCVHFYRLYNQPSLLTFLIQVPRYFCCRMGVVSCGGNHELQVRASFAILLQ